MNKVATFLMMVSTSGFAFGQSYNCDYKNMEGKSGKVKVTLKDSELSAKLNRKIYSAQNCIVDRTMVSEIMATCDEDSGTGMGFMLKDSSNKQEGYLVIEELSFFAELDC